MTSVSAACSGAQQPRARRRIVRLWPDRIDALVDAHRLTFVARGVLTELVLLADGRTGRLEGMTVTALAEHLRFDGGHGRRRVRAALDELERAGVIRCSFSRGHEGTVEVLVYDELTGGVAR